MNHTYEIELTVAHLPNWFDPDGVMDENEIEHLIDQWVTRAVDLLEANGDTVAYFGDGFEDRAWMFGQRIDMPLWAESIITSVDEEF